jgi:hypothetical protein
MIDFANNHIPDVNKILQKTAIDLKYKYYNVSRFADIVINPSEDTWSGINFVSIYENVITGFIKVKFTNPYRAAELSMFNTISNLVFMQDVREVIIMLFNVYKVPRISFSVLIGNPVEQVYDKVIGSFGGRIWGKSRKATLAMDGEVCDMKHYEILYEDFLQSKVYQRGEANE